ncbi:MAG: tetratricopeptide repeat protein [Saprospiraceae bacterium]|nr:tetratricopeptide repeat protein [Saprospiraceae bacterium]
MEHLNSNQKMYIRQLVSRYEAMSQKETVSFQEETVFLQMIDFCHTANKNRLALRIADDAIAQHPFSVNLYLKKAYFLLDRHKIEESLVTVEQAELFAPQHFQIGLLHARLLALKGQHKKALVVLSDIKINATTEEGSNLYLLEAQLYEDLGQYSKMFDALRKSLSLNCSNTEGYEKMIWATEYSQRYAESVKFHNRLLDRDAYNWRAWLNLGFAQEALENYNEAIEAFEYAFAIDERCRAAYMEAGELHMLLGDYQRAQIVYENAIFNTSEDALILQKLGLCYEKQDNPHTAMHFYQRALELNANDSETYFRIGECYMTFGKWHRAIEVFERATVINNRKEDYYVRLADAYWRTEQFGKALSSFRKAALTAPEDINCWLRYAGFLYSVGQEKKALQVLQDAQNYVFDAQIEYCQIACLMSLGRRSEALYRLSEALAEDFDKHTALLNWRPDLAENSDFQNLINDYKPYR